MDDSGSHNPDADPDLGGLEPASTPAPSGGTPAAPWEVPADPRPNGQEPTPSAPYPPAPPASFGEYVPSSSRGDEATARLPVGGPPAPAYPRREDATARYPVSAPPPSGGGGDPAAPRVAASHAPPPRSPSSSSSGRGPLIGIALLSSLLGAGIVVGVLAIAGNLHSGSTTTVVEQAAGGTSVSVPAASTGGTTNAAALYARLSPGIVDITATSQSQSQGFLFGGSGGGGSQTDLGSGFEIDKQGDILTAGHVVDGATSITVTFQNGTTKSAHLLGEDRAWDVAVIKVDPSGIALSPLTLGSSRSLKVGDYLAAIGDPFGYDRSLSTGVVAGLDRTISAPNGFSIAYAIQTDAALNPGNSGGPVLDADGQVVGIADQIATGGNETDGTATSSGVGFAVPIDLAKIDLPQLEQGKPAAHAYLGVSTTDAPDDAGVLLQGVSPGTPAAAAGLRTGDVLTAFNGEPLHGSADLIDDIATEVPGNKVTLTVKRGGSTLTIKLTLGAQPSEAPSAG